MSWRAPAKEPGIRTLQRACIGLWRGLREQLQIRLGWKSPGGVARVHQFRVEEDIELAGLAGQDFDRAAPMAFEPGLHTEGLRLVASGGAVMDANRHSAVS